MKIKASFFTSTGKVRWRNEDGLLLDRQLVAGTSMGSPAFSEIPGNGHIIVVADGLGGHADGELATKAVLETFMWSGDRLVDARSLADVLGDCKKALDAMVEKGRGVLGLGATVAGIVIGNGSEITAFNCGDCRVYHFANGYLKRVTKDHSLVQQLLDRGDITEDELRFHPRKNILTSGLVGDLNRRAPKFFSCKVPVSRWDRFLICSDGVWESMSARELGGIIGEGAIQDAANALAQKVMKNGASDNYTFIIAEIQ